jgi:hypothetical protein
MAAQVTTLRSVRSSGSALRATAPARSTALPAAPVEASVTSIAPVPAPASAPAARDSRAELVRLSDTTWRVCDTEGTPGERGYIVGYLQEVDDEFEMLWMHPRPGVVHRHTSFEDAERAIAVRLRLFAK